MRDLEKVTAFVDATDTRKRYTVEDALSDMVIFGNKILDAYDITQKHGSASLEMQLIFDSIKANLNDYVQGFLDVVAVLFVASEKTSGEKICSLRQAIRFYTSTYTNYSEDCGNWIEFLQRRNELIHEYYNHEFLNEELRIALSKYSDCVKELIVSLHENAAAGDLLEKVIRKG